MAIPLLNPSPVTVENVETLAQNFAENAVSTLCQAALGAGTFAIGGKLLGAKPLPPQAALATTAAFLAAATLCPSGFSPDGVFGEPASFSGGQCASVYAVFVQFGPLGGPPNPPTVPTEVLGPVSILEQIFINSPLGGRQYALRIQGDNDPQPRIEPLGFREGTVEFYGFWLRRNNGQPDNCGDPPRTGGQLIVNNVEGDTFNEETIVNNSNNVYVTPVIFNFGGVNFPINMTFGDIRIDSLLPLNFDINISGTNFNFGRDPDGVLRPKPSNPRPDFESDDMENLEQILALLEEIAGCVCSSSPPVEVITAFVPVAVDAGGGCSTEVVQLEVSTQSYTQQVAQIFVESAALGRIGCEALQPPIQLEETLIFAATTLEDGRELFTGNILPEVVSLRLKITSFQEGIVPNISLYPAANQRKFGSVSFVTESVSGGGDSQYVYDVDTFVPLPERGKPGKLRVLMKELISFEVYDTGERL